VSQEKVRLEVPRCYLEEHLTLIKKIVPIVPTELLVNLGETGLSEWENRKSKLVLASTQEQESTLHYAAAKKCILRADADPTDIDHLARIFKAYELVTTSTTVRVSWKKTGFESCKLDDTFQLPANAGKIRDSSEFSEIWGMNFPQEWLSARRRVEKWGFMNRQFSKGRYLKTLRQKGLD
jgi:hypothetical protein